MAFMPIEALKGIADLADQFVNRREENVVRNADGSRTRNGITFSFWLAGSICGEDIALQELDLCVHFAFFGSCSVRYAVTNRSGEVDFYLVPTGHNPCWPRFKQMPLAERPFRAPDVPAEAWQWASDHDSCWRDAVGSKASDIRAHVEWMLRQQAGIGADAPAQVRVEVTNEETFGAFKFVRITTMSEWLDYYSQVQIRHITERKVQVVDDDTAAA